MLTPTFNLILFFVIGPLWFFIQNRFKDYRASLINGISILLFSFAIIHQQIDVFVLLSGWALGYLSDYIGVYCGYWKYDTKDGYSNWIGLAWGLVSLIVFQSKNITLFIPLMLIIVALWILATRQRYWPTHLVDWAFILVKLFGFFFYPMIFVMSFALGIIIEYIAVEIFKYWQYDRFSYLHIGLGYTMILIIITALADYLQGVTIPSALLYALIISVGYILQITLTLRGSKKLVF